MSKVVDNQTKYTYQEYRHFPDDGKRHEVINGDHYVSPAPGTYHQSLSKKLILELYHKIEEPQFGILFYAPIDVELSEIDIVQPDIVAVRKEREHIVTPSRIIGAPDLVVEILSESNRRHDLELKRAMYERTGVGEYWLVDPETHAVTVLILEGGTYRDTGSFSESLKSAGFPGVAVDLRSIW